MVQARWSGCTQNGGPISSFNEILEVKYDFFSTSKIHWIMWKFERLYAKLC
jgi:hypothetical protein